MSCASSVTRASHMTCASNVLRFCVLSFPREQTWRSENNSFKVQNSIYSSGVVDLDDLCKHFICPACTLQ